MSSYLPNHRVTLYRHANGLKEEDVSGDIVSIHTGKRLGTAAGGFTFEATFNRRFEDKRIDQLLGTNDLVKIELDRGDGSGLQCVMLGLVSRRGRTVRYDKEGRPHRRVRVQGMDLGKLLIRHQCGWDLAQVDINDGDQEAVRLSMGVWQYTGTPSENVGAVLDNLFFPFMGPWVKERMKTLFDASDTWQTSAKTLLKASGATWDAMKSMANEPWNILYTDTEPTGTFRVILNRNPFDTETGRLVMADAEWYTVPLSDVIHEDLSVDDADLVNYASFQNYANMFGPDGFPFIFIRQSVRDPESVALNGFRPFTPATCYAPFLPEKNQDAGQKQDSVLPEIQARTKALYNWHKLSHTYEFGSLEIKGTPEPRIAHGILFDDNEYFVEGVNHDYFIERDGRHYKTRLEVTRGQAHG